MMDYKINQQERDALKGLPHLPRLTYFEIRPFMDYTTGIVGIKRGISYQSLREELYVEPHTGYVNSGSPSKQQLRRALQTLERAGLISIQSIGKKLILKCELATWDYCVQNKPDTNPTHQPGANPTSKNNIKTNDYGFSNAKADTGKSAQPGTPPVSDININIFVFLKNEFEKFWQIYPVKIGKEKSWEIFKNLSPTEDLCQTILDALKKQCVHRQSQKGQGIWMPNWRNPNNWLLQKGWLDELTQTNETNLVGENNHAHSRQYSKTSERRDFMWESCKDAFNTSGQSDAQNAGNLEHAEITSNIVNINRFQRQTYR